MEIITILKQIPRIPEEEASEFNFRVREELKKRNFVISTEVRVPNRGDGRGGRIDIVAEKNGETFAIELDRITPRKKSVHKVSNYPCTLGLVVLRDSDYILGW